MVKSCRRTVLRELNVNSLKKTVLGAVCLPYMRFALPAVSPVQAWFRKCFALNIKRNRRRKTLWERCETIRHSVVTNREIVLACTRTHRAKEFWVRKSLSSLGCFSRHIPRKPNFRSPYPILNKNNNVWYKAVLKKLLEKNKAESFPTCGYFFPSVSL